MRNPTKLGVRTEGPYTIECAPDNINLTTLLSEGVVPTEITFMDIGGKYNSYYMNS